MMLELGLSHKVSNAARRCSSAVTSFFSEGAHGDPLGAALYHAIIHAEAAAKAASQRSDVKRISANVADRK
jgi:hypothetical protein